MSRPVAVLRPEPGNTATAARVEAAGWTAIRLPLFVARPCAWAAPDPTAFDALVLTSANAPRLAGPELAKLATLPVFAVGVATADAARDAGLHVRMTGTADVAALLADARAMQIDRALHLAGRDRSTTSPVIAQAITVYGSDPVDPEPGAITALAGSVALLHSPRAAVRMATLVDTAGVSRAQVRVAALSDAVARAAGEGWGGIVVPANPTDRALIDAARSLVG